MNTAINVFVPSLSGGGAEKAAVLFAEYLKNKHPAVTCRIFLLEDVDVYTGIFNVSHVETLPRGIFKKIDFLRSNLDQKDVNLIYLSTSKFFTLLFLARRSQKVYAFLQNPLEEALDLKKQNVLIRAIRFQLLRLIYVFGVKKVFPIAPGIEIELNRLGISNTNLVPNAIRNIPHISRSTSSAVDRQLNILSAGRLHPQKNYVRLIEAARYIKTDFVINIFGEGQQKQELQNLISSTCLGDRVFLRGFVDDLGPELARADLFLLTSDYEGFGNVIIEALSYGLKIISTDVPHGPSYILNSKSIGILTEKDPVKVAEAIDWAYSSGWLYDNTEKCIARAQDFLIDNVGEKIIKELIDENHA